MKAGSPPGSKPSRTVSSSSVLMVIRTSPAPSHLPLNLTEPLPHSCVFWGDLFGTLGDNPQQPVTQLGDIIRARKLFAYGELRDYFDHPNCVGWVRMAGGDRDGLAVVVCNGDEGFVTDHVPFPSSLLTLFSYSKQEETYGGWK